MFTRFLTKGNPVLLVALAVLACTVIHAQKQSSPKERAIELLQTNLRLTGLGQEAIRSFQVSDAYEDKNSGNFFVYLQQATANIPVYNKISVFVFNKETLIEKKLDYLRKFPASPAPSTIPAIAPDQALRLAASQVGMVITQTPKLLRQNELATHFVYRVPGSGSDSLTADLVWLPVADRNDVNNNGSGGNINGGSGSGGSGSAVNQNAFHSNGLITPVKLAWNVRIVTPGQLEDWFVRIDAQTGEYLEKNSLIVSEAVNQNCVDDVRSATAAMGATAATAATAATTAINATTATTPTPVFDFPPPSVSSATYRVYPLGLESPNYGTRILETDPWLKAGAANNAVTLGWHYDNTTNFNLTRGNNVWAQENIAGDNTTNGLTDNSSTSIPVLTFDKPLDPAQQPNASNNLRAAIDNLFYWSNLVHDVSYQYGFDEAAGNFQASNLGRGGAGNDYVHSFAESGAGLNNANFSTPPDGEAPVMRMYQWNSATHTTLHINSPAPIATDYIAVEGAINLVSQLANTGSRTANIVLLTDAIGSSAACTSITNASAINGNIALIDRGGGCSFMVKIKAAQNAGATGVIVINNVSAAPFVMTGSDITITIPAVMISLADGNTLKANLAGLSGTLSSTGVLIDGSLDNGIVAHEFTHGISNRITGGPSNAGCLVNAEQMGEGWSDYLALMMTTKWSTATTGDGTISRPIGTYALAQSPTGPGIRAYPYSTNLAVNPWTYGMMAGSTGGEPHYIGEIWCATIWDMTWNIIQQEGISGDLYHGTSGNNIALQLVMDGMKYQPCSPGFLDGRDAILKADSIRYGFAHKCAIWNAFARRGMGKSAIQGSSNSYVDQVAATDVPVGVSIAKTADKNTFMNGEVVTYTIRATCDCAALSNITVVDTLSDKLTYVSSTGGTYSAPVVRFTGLNFAAGETKILGIQATVAGNYAAPVTLIDDTRDPAAYTWSNSITNGSNTWSESTTRSHSTSHSFFAPDAGSTTDFALNSANVVLDTLSTLSFWHYYETEPGYDGGFIEITTNNGASWQDLGPYIKQNGYTSTLDPTSSPAGNHGAFSGSSGGVFIQTIVRLTGFAGATARIRFRFTSDVTFPGEGWYVDDILLRNEKGIVNNAFAYNGTTLLGNNFTFGLLTPGTLPVHFISFDAKKENAVASLHWKVTDEMNVSGYVVERSVDGRVFGPIGLAPFAAGNGDKDYYFIDQQPSMGINYYRISEQDIDGRFTRSVTRNLRFTDAPVKLTLVPVPTYNHIVQVNIENATAESFRADVLNTVGQAVRTYRLKAGQNQLSLDGLAAGIYYLKCELDNGKTEVRKLVIR